MLRGSTLTPEDRKRVILEAEASMDGRLTVQRVSEAVRMLGVSFFQQLASQKKTSRKVYDATAMTVSEDAAAEEGGIGDEAYFGDELSEDDFIQGLASEGHDDAALILDFEAAAEEIVQSDS